MNTIDGDGSRMLSQSIPTSWTYSVYLDHLPSDPNYSTGWQVPHAEEGGMNTYAAAEEFAQKFLVGRRG